MACQYRSTRCGRNEGILIFALFGNQECQRQISRDEVSQRLRERYGDKLYDEPTTSLDGGYEIIPPDSTKIEEIEEYNRKLRQALYAELNKKIEEI